MSSGTASLTIGNSSEISLVKIIKYLWSADTFSLVSDNAFHPVFSYTCDITVGGVPHDSIISQMEQSVNLHVLSCTVLNNDSYNVNMSNLARIHVDFPDVRAHLVYVWIFQ